VRPAFQAEYFGLRAFGALQGLMFTVSTLGSVAGPIFAGWVHDSTDTYRQAFVVLALATLAAAPAVLMIGLYVTVRVTFWAQRGQSSGG
jgi:MFS family permease